MATGASNCAALAANWAKEVLGALHCPKVTNARNTLPVILEARWTNPVRRAQASIWAVAKNSVTFSTTPSHGSAIAVSFASLVDDNPMPSYHGGETAPSPTNSRAYLFSFMRMGTPGARSPPSPAGRHRPAHLPRSGLPDHAGRGAHGVCASLHCAGGGG